MNRSRVLNKLSENTFKKSLKCLGKVTIVHLMSKVSFSSPIRFYFHCMGDFIYSHCKGDILIARETFSLHGRHSHCMGDFIYSHCKGDILIAREIFSLQGRHSHCMGDILIAWETFHCKGDILIGWETFSLHGRHCLFSLQGIHSHYTGGFVQCNKKTICVKICLNVQCCRCSSLTNQEKLLS